MSLGRGPSRPGAAARATHDRRHNSCTHRLRDGYHNATRVDALKKCASDCRVVLDRAEDQLEGATGNGSVSSGYPATVAPCAPHPVSPSTIVHRPPLHSDFPPPAYLRLRGAPTYGRVPLTSLLPWRCLSIARTYSDPSHITQPSYYPSA